MLLPLLGGAPASMELGGALVPELVLPPRGAELPVWGRWAIHLLFGGLAVVGEAGAATPGRRASQEASGRVPRKGLLAAAA